MSDFIANKRVAPLEANVQQLERLTCTVSSEQGECITHSPDLVKEPATPSIFKKILSSASYFFSSNLFSQQRDPLKDEINQVVDLFSKELYQISQLEQETQDQQEIVPRAFQAISQSNDNLSDPLLDQLNKSLSDQNVSAYLPKQLLHRKIQLPQSTFANQFNPISRNPFEPCRIGDIVRFIFIDQKAINSSSLTRIQQDLFRMKAITLLKECLGIKEAIYAVNQAPIQVIEEIVEDKEASSEIIVKQTICSDKGQVYIITGYFDRLRSDHLKRIETAFRQNKFSMLSKEFNCSMNIFLNNRMFFTRFFGFSKLS